MENYVCRYKTKNKKQRIHLTSILHFLIKQIELKIEIRGFVQDSEERLNRALRSEAIQSDHIDSMRVSLAEDQRLYSECLAFIRDLEIEITATKTAIEKSKLKLQQLFFPKKTSGLFKQKTETKQTEHFLVKPSISSLRTF